MINRWSRVVLAVAIAASLAWPAAAQAPTLVDGSITTAGADCAAATNCLGFDVGDLPSFTLYLNVGTSGTFNWEASVDATANDTGTWFTVPDDVGGALTATADGAKSFTNPGYRRFRVRASAISGAAPIVAYRGQAGLRSTASATVASDGLTGGAVPGSASYLGANVGGNLVGLTATGTSLNVNITGGAGAGGTSSNFGAAVPSAGTAGGYSDGTNMQAARVFDLDSGAGTQYGLGVELRTAASGGSVALFPAPAALGDNAANPTLAGIQTFPMIWDAGVGNWDRWTGAVAITGTATVAGTITANAGTNLNTSALALEAGGNLTTIAGDTTDIEAAIELLNPKFPAAATLANNMAVPSTTLIGAVCMVYDGVTLDFCLNGDVGIGTGGSNTSRVTIDTGDDVSEAATLIKANLVAHGATDAGNPLKIGFFGETSVSGRTMATDGQRVDWVGGVDGIPFMRPYSGPEDILNGSNSNTDGASTELIPAQAAGIRSYITSWACHNSSATALYVELKDGTMVKYRGTAPAGDGFNYTFPVPLQGTATTAWNSDGSAAATTLYCSANGFKSKL